ncbi:hypothetical protein RAA17_21230 [Komagataeibacter rhaeticus]|nr:hypothetical protein [Komagataeibacter rhaeticus]
MTLVPARAGHLVYQVEYGQNPRLPAGAAVPLPLNPLYLDFESQPDRPELYDMSLYCGSRPVPFGAISLTGGPACSITAARPMPCGPIARLKVATCMAPWCRCCATHHDAAGSDACTRREEAAYATIMARRLPAPHCGSARPM